MAVRLADKVFAIGACFKQIHTVITVARTTADRIARIALVDRVPEDFFTLVVSTDVLFETLVATAVNRPEQCSDKDPKDASNTSPQLQERTG